MATCTSPEQPQLDHLRPERFQDLARSQARRFARSPSDVDDLAQEGLLALCRALSTHPAPEKIRDPWAWARTVLRRTMRDVRASGAWLTDHAVALDDAPPLHSPEADAEDHAIIEGYLRDLALAVGEAEAWVAENLIAPGEEIGAWVLRDEEDRYWAALDADPEDPDARWVNAERVTHRQLAEALGWSRARFGDTLGEIRRFTADWMRERGFQAPSPEAVARAAGIALPSA